MLKRDYKVTGEGSIHHAYNRGNNKELIFFDKTDYKAFMFRVGLGLGEKPDTLFNNTISSTPRSRIRVNSKPGLYKLHAFCLMPNHFHLLIEQCSDTPISKFMQQVCTSYAMYINKKYKRVGYVFQDRFKSVLIESSPQLLWTSAYIHLNPVKSSLVKHPEDYMWSSYLDYTNERNTSFVTKNFILEAFGGNKNFKSETDNIYKTEVSRGDLDMVRGR